MMSKLRVILNGASLISVRLATNVLSLVTLPLYLSLYGQERYGLFILAISTVQSFLLFDFGVGTGLTKFTAEFSIDEQRNRFSTVYSGTLIFTALAGLVFFILIFTTSFWAYKFIDIDVQSRPIAQTIFQIAAAYCFVLPVIRLSQFILEGYQLHYVANYCHFIGIAGYLVLYMCVRFLRLDFVTFSFLYLAVDFLVFLMCVNEIRRRHLLAGISFTINLRKFKGFLQTDFVKFSLNVFVIQLVAFCYALSDKYIIGSILSVAMVTIYTIVTKPMFIVRMINNQSLLVINPLIASEYRQGNKEFLRKIVRQVSAVHAALVCPLAGFVVVIIEPFIRVWVGDEYSRYAYWGAIYASVYFIAPLTAIIERLLIQTGFEKTVRNINLSITAVNLIVSVIGTYWFGIGGVVIGSLIQVAAAVPIYLGVYMRVRDGSLRDVLSADVVSTLCYVLAVTCIFKHLGSIVKIDGWVDLLLFSAACATALCMLSIWIFIKRGIPQSLLQLVSVSNKQQNAQGA